MNAAPPRLDFRLTVRDGRGGVNSADTTMTLAPGTGPFLVTSQGTPVTYEGGSTQSVTWSVAGTNTSALAQNVKISLSSDGGFTYPDVLVASTPNDGSESVTIPGVATAHARIKVEAVGNVFFDISNADFTIETGPEVTDSLGGGSQSVQYSDSPSPDVTVTATDGNADGSALTAAAAGLPAGMSLQVTATSADGDRPGTRTWKVGGPASDAPGPYPVTVTVTDDSAREDSTSFTLVVTKEDADAAYSGDVLVFTPAGGSSANVVLRATVRDSSLFSGDTEPGDIRNATVGFKEGAATLCGPLPVTLFDGALTTGTASCTTPLSLGAHTIDVVVDGFYTAPVAMGTVEVAQPNGLRHRRRLPRDRSLRRELRGGIRFPFQLRVQPQQQEPEEPAGPREHPVPAGGTDLPDQRAPPWTRWGPPSGRPADAMQRTTECDLLGHRGIPVQGEPQRPHQSVEPRLEPGGTSPCRSP